MTIAQTIAATRFGYGLPAPEGAPGTAQAMLTALAGPDHAAQDHPIMGLADYLPYLQQMRAIKGEGKGDPVQAAKRDALQEEIGRAAHSAIRFSFARAVTAPDGFRERLAVFWADHFTVVSTRASDVLLPYTLVEDAIRPQMTGRFADLLTAVTLHPAMLLYLDQANSVGPNSRLGLRQDKGLNENLAREVIELHSLGVGAGYSQTDVTEMAKLLTGLTFSAQDGLMFEARRAEPGDKTVLGKTYSGTGLEPIKAALVDLAQRPETAQHIARKLVVHFVSDTPDADLVSTVAQAFATSDGDLMATYAALLGHPLAWGPQMEKARQPFDFIVASLRALGLTAAQLNEMPFKQFQSQFLVAMRVMGQPFKQPDGPNGIPEEAAEWITPQGLARRITWAMQAPGRLVQTLPDPVDLAQACLAERASEALLWAAARAEDTAQGVGLVLASAEFNRR